MSSPSGPRFPLVQLASDHDVRHFTCGRQPGAAEIDEYLTGSALAEQAAGLSQVWIATDTQATDREQIIAAYFTLSPLSIPLTPAVLATLGLGPAPYRAVGGYLLWKLGVAAHLQGHGVGSDLVAAAIKIARRARSEVGGAFRSTRRSNRRVE